MKKTIVLLLGILLLNNVSFGQSKYTPHVKGDDAMLFQFSGLAYLGAGSYRGGFGYKKFLNDKTAVRGAFSIRNEKETIPWDTGNWPDGYIGEDGYDKEFRIGFEAAGEIHRNNGKVDPYYGAGLGFSLTRTKKADVALGAAGSTLTQTVIKNDFNSNAATTFAVFALLGVEYTINAALSLSAEYHLGFSSSSQPDMKISGSSDSDITVKGGKSSFFGLTSVGVLTLAIYLN